MLKAIVKFLQGLNSNKSPSEIAVACSLGVLLGFMPKNNALWFIILIFFFFVRLAAFATVFGASAKFTY